MCVITRVREIRKQNMVHAPRRKPSRSWDLRSCETLALHPRVGMHFSADGLLLFIRMNPREPAATARRTLRIRVLANRAAERLVHPCVGLRTGTAI